MKLSLEKLLRLFLVHELEHIPLLGKSQAQQGFLNFTHCLAQKKVLRYLSELHHLSTSIQRLLPKLLEKQNKETFLAQLKKKKRGAKAIPLIFQKQEELSLELYPLSTFQAQFNPITKIGLRELLFLTDQYAFPLFITNSLHQAIYQNEKAKRLLGKIKATGSANGKLFREKTFFQKLAEKIQDREEPAEAFLRRTFHFFKLHFKLQKSYFEKRPLYLITVLSTEKIERSRVA